MRLLRSHVRVCTHTHSHSHTHTHIFAPLTVTSCVTPWLSRGPFPPSIHFTFYVCFGRKVPGKGRLFLTLQGNWECHQVPGAPNGIFERDLSSLLTLGFSGGRPAPTDLDSPPTQWGWGGGGRLTPSSSSSSSSSRHCMGLTWGSLRTLSSAIIP